MIAEVGMANGVAFAVNKYIIRNTVHAELAADGGYLFGVYHVVLTGDVGNHCGICAQVGRGVGDIYPHYIGVGKFAGSAS